MDLPPPTTGPMPEPVAAETDATAPPSRSRMLTVGVPAVLAVTALGGFTFLVGSGDDAVRTGDVATTSTSSTTTTTTVEDVFTSAGVTVDSTAAPTTRAPATTTSTTTTSTTTAPTTTLAPPTTTAATLPEQPSQPIAPPPDPRGAEDQIQLGGISIPSLGLDAPLLEGIRLTTLDNGPGHWPGTAMPGQVGNVVVAAHRTSHGGPFRNIDQLVAGDIVLFTTDAGEIEYTVTGTQIVNPDAIWIVDPTDTPTATLFACHPPGSVAQRIVVNLELSS
ncbi:MAG: class E sortase [Ilumatobacter sp.]|uniref:sortase n=1 Tax=Ilumatobacter sp. TaxID=1967498 RepID=UPI003C75DF1A